MPDNFIVKDALGASKTMRTSLGADGAHRVHHKFQGGQDVVHLVKTVPNGPAEQVTVTSTPVVGPVSLIGDKTNVGDVWIGGSGVTTANGFPVPPYGAGPPVVISVEDLNFIYCVSGTTGEKLRVLAGGFNA